MPEAETQEHGDANLKFNSIAVVKISTRYADVFNRLSVLDENVRRRKCGWCGGIGEY